jgi:hypothetical protein
MTFPFLNNLIFTNILALLYIFYMNFQSLPSCFPVLQLITLLFPLHLAFPNIIYGPRFLFSVKFFLSPVLWHCSLCLICKFHYLFIYSLPLQTMIIGTCSSSRPLDTLVIKKNEDPILSGT